MDKPSEYPAPPAAVSNDAGVLWVVATPIGHMQDLSPRARAVLGAVDWVAAEDTRRTGRLLEQIGARPRRMSLHEHNEASRIPRLQQLLAAGRHVALVSDAGTPLLSDPGARLVAAVAAAGVAVSPVPGPCSVAAALSVAGFAADRFRFEGFLPARSESRRRRLEALAREPVTSVFFEAPHRIAACLQELAAVAGPDRQVAVARELTKVHETVLRGSVARVAKQVAADADQQRGELVVVLEPAAQRAAGAEEADDVLRALLAELPTKQAARLAARITGAKRNELYQRALALGSGGGSDA